MSSGKEHLYLRAGAPPHLRPKQGAVGGDKPSAPQGTHHTHTPSSFFVVVCGDDEGGRREGDAERPPPRASLTGEGGGRGGGGE